MEHSCWHFRSHNSAQHTLYLIVTGSDKSWFEISCKTINYLLMSPQQCGAGTWLRWRCVERGCGLVAGCGYSYTGSTLLSTLLLQSTIKLLQARENGTYLSNTFIFSSPSPLVLEHPLHAAVNEAEVRELDPELRVAVAGPRLPPHPPRLPRPRLAASAVRPQLRVGEHPAPGHNQSHTRIFFSQ